MNRKDLKKDNSGKGESENDVSGKEKPNKDNYVNVKSEKEQMRK